MTRKAATQKATSKQRCGVASKGGVPAAAAAKRRSDRAPSSAASRTSAIPARAVAAKLKKLQPEWEYLRRWWPVLRRREAKLRRQAMLFSMRVPISIPGAREKQQLYLHDLEMYAGSSVMLMAMPDVDGWINTWWRRLYG